MANKMQSICFTEALVKATLSEDLAGFPEDLAKSTLKAVKDHFDKELSNRYEPTPPDAGLKNSFRPK